MIAPVHHGIRIGISGWRYAGWRGVFYPPDLPHRRELQYAAQIFNSIEINGSFYSLQRPASYQAWYQQTPDDFVFAVKGGRFITHMKRLRDIEQPLANFFASGLLLLRQKLGPILWQFPPNLSFDPERFAHFLELLPRDTLAAAKLARRHGPILSKARRWTEADANRPIRHAVEIRHPSFLTGRFIRLLRANRVALVFADSGGLWPYAEDLTADFVYIRLHGAEELYASGYTDAAIDCWARRIRIWHRGGEPDDAKLVLPDRRARRRKSRDVYVYFDNDVKVKAPFDAIRLAERLRQIDN
ncbi:DUF72 domain-containing protein [Fontivita pretiosa]|uniref:DUF72 domain-containing protein n=1 Tax=Fontivita pretiosa TaxID=2989684 RepID=UPI003D1790AC